MKQIINKEELLQYAREHIFSTGLRDSGSKLCVANMQYGIAKLHILQEYLGLPQNATFIGTPDMTVTRNVTRWNSGFGYGGKISWGNGENEIMVLDLKPNNCGMLVGGLKELPSSATILSLMDKLTKSNLEIDNIPLKLDFYKGNHFIDLFSVKPSAGYNFSKYMFVIHGSGAELRGNNEKNGFGLYFDASSRLKELAEIFDTPFGTLHILEGDKAVKYYEFAKYSEEFAKRRRKLVANYLFGDYELISNETHQGLLNINEIVLGCNGVKENDETIYPLTLHGDLPAYLVKSIPNLSPEGIEVLGFEKRAKRLGVYERLCKANIIPHGGGYNFPSLVSDVKVREINGNRYFEAEASNGRGKTIFSNVRELPYEYRGLDVVLKSVELGFIELVAKLIPIYVLKT